MFDYLGSSSPAESAQKPEYYNFGQYSGSFAKVKQSNEEPNLKNQGSQALNAGEPEEDLTQEGLIKSLLKDYSYGKNLQKAIFEKA